MGDPEIRSAPGHGWCQRGRLLAAVTVKEREQKCPRRARADATYCAECHAEAMERVRIHISERSAPWPVVA